MDIKALIEKFYELLKDFLALILGDEKADELEDYEQDIKDIIEAE